MSRFKNETGNIYQSFKVLHLSSEIYQTKGSNKYWDCLCLNCNSEQRIRGDKLRTSNNLRCFSCNPVKFPSYQKSSLIQGKDIPMYNFIDEIGNIYGELTVIKRDINYNYKSARWICQCSCGNTVSRLGSELRRKANHSCGCISLLSKGEQRIKEILINLNYRFQQEYSFKDLLGTNNHPLRFDFCILDNQDKVLGLIEYDGQQHFFPASGWGGKEQLKYIQHHDILKTNYAIINQIPLLRISYLEYNNILDYVVDFLKNL